MRQCQKPCWSQGRKHPLLPPHQLILPCHHEGYQIGQAWFPLGEFVLGTPDDHFFYRLGDDLQNDLFHHLARDGGETDWPGIFWVLPLALFEDWTNNSLPAVRHLSLSPLFFSDGDWHSTKSYQLPQHSREYPMKADGFWFCDHP